MPIQRPAPRRTYALLTHLCDGQLTASPQHRPPDGVLSPMRFRPTPFFAAGAAALALAAVPAPANASSSQQSIFEAPREMLGSDDALRQQTLDEIRAFGVTHMRVLVIWSSVVRKPNARKKPASLDETDPNSGGYDFSRYDAIFSEAAQRGI